MLALVAQRGETEGGVGPFKDIELAKGIKETREILSNIKPGQSVGIFIGPEGGFEEEEVQAAMEAGAKPVTLGKRILRTETAGMTMLSILMFTLEKEEE